MLTCGFGVTVALGFGFGVGAAAGGVAGAVRASTRRRVVAPFVSLPSPFPVAELRNVPLWVTRAESPIVRSTPGPSVPRVHWSSADVMVQLPPAGCWVTAEERDPTRCRVGDDDVVRLVRAVVPHPQRVGDRRLAVHEQHLRRRVLDHLHVHELVRLHRRRRRRRRGQRGSREGRRRRRGGAVHGHARRVRVELVVGLDLRAWTGYRRADRRRSSGRGSSKRTARRRGTTSCR